MQAMARKVSTMTVYAEIAAATKAGPPKGSTQAYLSALVDKADKLSEKAWGGLSPKAQKWINNAIDAKEKGEEIPEPAGYEAGSDDDGGEEAPVKKSKANGKANGSAKPEKAAKGKAGKPVKVAKEEKAAKKPRKAVEKFDADAKITVVNKSPHKDGSLIAQRYGKLKTGMTVAAARKAGLSMLDLRCDVDRGNIKIK